MDPSSSSAVENTAHILSLNGLNCSSGMVCIIWREWRCVSGFRPTGSGSMPRKRSKQLRIIEQ